MPEPGEPRSKSEDPTEELPVLTAELEEAYRLEHKEELKKRRAKLREGIKQAHGLDDVVRALDEYGFTSVVENIQEVKDQVRKLAKDKDPAELGYTIERILATGNLFKGFNFDIGDAYLTKKIRQKLIDYIRDEIGLL